MHYKVCPPLPKWPDGPLGAFVIKIVANLVFVVLTESKSHVPSCLAVPDVSRGLLMP